MPKLLKYLLIVLAVVVALVAAAAIVIATTFDPNAYKPELIKLVQDKTRRTLSIPGDIRLTFFPRVGADLGEIVLSERQSTQTFASVRHASVSVAVIPLFSGNVVVDRVLLDGLSVRLHRDARGHTNLDDLLNAGKRAAGAPGKADRGPATVAATPMRLDIGGIAITDAALDYTDAATGRRLKVTKAKLTTGPIANGQASRLEIEADLNGAEPALDLHLGIDSAFTPHLDGLRLVLDGWSARLRGHAAGLANLEVAVSSPNIEVSPSSIKSASMTIAAAFEQTGRPVSVKLTTGLLADLGVQHFKLDKIAIDATAPNPAGGSASVRLQGQAALQLPQESAQLSLAGQLDTTTIDLKAGLRNFARPGIDFDVVLGDLDADRYLPAPDAASPSAPGAKGPASEDPAVDLSGLKALDASGTLKIKALKVAKIKASSLSTQLRLTGGKADLTPLSAHLYGGKVEGSLAAQAGQPQRLSARLTLTGVNLGPLLQDAIDKRPVDGQGNVTLDVSTSGATVSQLKKALNGTASVKLKDGAINGINIAGALRDAKSRLGAGPPQEQAAPQDKTDFTEFGANFQIRNGVARNDDLAAKTPLLRLGGAGDIDIGESRLDYTLKATVVPTLQGQGGPELEQLKGLTIPVRLSGPFSSPSWKIDVGSAASDRAKALVQQRQDQLREETQKKLDAEKARLQERLKKQAEEGLRNLLPR